MAMLAFGCAILAALAPWLLTALAPAVEIATGLPADAAVASLSRAAAPLRWVLFASVGLVVTAAALAAARRRWLAGRTRTTGPTWDCGYAQPSPRMQYTAASFVQPIADLFAPLLRQRGVIEAPAGFFPTRAALQTAAPDLWSEILYRPVSRAVVRGVKAIRWLQHGRTHFYVLYIAFTLIALLLWQLG